MKNKNESENSSVGRPLEPAPSPPEGGRRKMAGHRSPPYNTPAGGVFSPLRPVLDEKLDHLLATHMCVPFPPDLIGRTMTRLPQTRALPIPLWSWAVYVGFFSASVFGLAYWEWGALVSALGLLVLYLPKGISLVLEYPTIALWVVAAFLVNALILWLVATDFVLRRNHIGVMTR